MKYNLIVKFFVVLLLVFVIPNPISVQAASVSVRAGDLDVKEISIPKGSTCSLVLCKGKKTYYDATVETADEKIVSVDEYASLEAKKIGVTKVTLSYKGKKASCTVNVVKPYQFKVISAKRKGNSITFKVKNKMSKDVTFYKDGAISNYDDGADMGIDPVTVEKDVTIKAGKTESFTVTDYEENEYGVYFNTEYDDVKFQSYLSEDAKVVSWSSAGWRE